MTIYTSMVWWPKMKQVTALTSKVGSCLGKLGAMRTIHSADLSFTCCNNERGKGDPIPVGKLTKLQGIGHINEAVVLFRNLKEMEKS